MLYLPAYPGGKFGSYSLQIHLSYLNHWACADCTAMLPFEDTPSRAGKVTLSPNFTEGEKVKQNEKTEGFVSNERTRKKHKKNN